jgi:hypothetical protein
MEAWGQAMDMRCAAHLAMLEQHAQHGGQLERGVQREAVTRQMRLTALLPIN